MNQGVLQSSPVQQMVVAAGSPNWWSINNMRPPTQHQHHSSAAAPPNGYLPNQLTPPWDDVGQEPESWSQFLLGGSVGEGESHDLSHTKGRKMENWDQKHLNQSSNVSCFFDLKQEHTASGYTYAPINDEFQAAKPTNYWSHNMLSSSPKSCTTTLSSNLFNFSRQSSDIKHTKTDLSSECNSTATGGVAKKARIQPSSAQSPFKVRKEKLGDRIAALHQIVSPFGKTDTASVLLESIGYIRFLQSQVEALSLPYLGRGSGNMRHKNVESEEEAKIDLKSRGLCLVPVSCTLHFGSDNGADYWAPSFGGNLH